MKSGSNQIKMNSCSFDPCSQTGRSFRILAVVDEFTRERVVLEADHSMTERKVAEARIQVPCARALEVWPFRTRRVHVQASKQLGSGLHLGPTRNLRFSFLIRSSACYRPALPGFEGAGLSLLRRLQADPFRKLFTYKSFLL
jgi:hypothetical protein